MPKGLSEVVNGKKIDHTTIAERKENKDKHSSQNTTNKTKS